jgi:hypothetical protein
MSRNQALILAGLGMVTFLVCTMAFTLVAIRFVPVPEPATPTPSPMPTATLPPTSTPAPTATRTPRPDVGDKYGALAVCKDFVKDRLIAPRDAKWPAMFDEGPEVTQVDATTWRIEYWVDAANRMGAHIRMTYTCEVSYLGADKWRLEALSLHER